MIIIYILIYLFGVAVFHYLEFKKDKEFTYFGYLSWIGVVLMLYVILIDCIRKKIN